MDDEVRIRVSIGEDRAAARLPTSGPPRGRSRRPAGFLATAAALALVAAPTPLRDMPSTPRAAMPAPTTRWSAPKDGRGTAAAKPPRPERQAPPSAATTAAAARPATPPPPGIERAIANPTAPSTRTVTASTADQRRLPPLLGPSQVGRRPGSPPGRPLALDDSQALAVARAALIVGGHADWSAGIASSDADWVYVDTRAADGSTGTRLRVDRADGSCTPAP